MTYIISNIRFFLIVLILCLSICTAYYMGYTDGQKAGMTASTGDEPGIVWFKVNYTEINEIQGNYSPDLITGPAGPPGPVDNMTTPVIPIPKDVSDTTLNYIWWGNV